LGYSQNAVEQTATNVTDVKEAVDAVKQAITQVNPTAVYFTEKLQELAKSLKVPAEYIYKTLVKQQQINGYTILVLLFVGILLLGLASTQINHAQWGTGSYYYDSKDKSSPYWEGYLWNKHTTIFLAAVIFGGIMTIASLIMIPQMITGILNPEYGAIKEIMRLF